MTTQRDRLIEIAHEASHAAAGTEESESECVRDEAYERDYADALLAHGVRVVDADTLAAALAQLPEYAETPSYRRQAIELLAALDLGPTR